MEEGETENEGGKEEGGENMERETHAYQRLTISFCVCVCEMEPVRPSNTQTPHTPAHIQTHVYVGTNTQTNP